MSGNTDECCDFGTNSYQLDQPKKPFLIANECAGQRQIAYPVKAGEVIVENQLLSLDNGELVVDDSDPTLYIGFAKCNFDGTTQTGGMSVWVEGEFDEDQAVFATQSANATRLVLAQQGIYLRKRL